MRNLLMIVLFVVIAFTTADSGRRRAFSGSVKDNVYTDKKYNFTLKLNDEWKHSLRKNDDNYRLLLTQRNYDIPPDYVSAPDYTQIPRLILWTDTSSLHAFAFLDSLVNEDYRSKQKNELLKELEILTANLASGTRREKTVPRGRKPIEIGGEQAVLWLAKSQYIKEVAVSAASLGGKRVYGAFGGAIVVVKHNGRVFVFHLMAEWDFFESILEQAVGIINTLEFEGAEEKDKGKDSKG